MPHPRKNPTHPVFGTYRIHGKDGYAEITTTKDGLKFKKLHRAVVHKLVLESPHFFALYGWPDTELEQEGPMTWEWAWVVMESFDVHHIDFDKLHNCSGNLMLLDRRIHNYLMNSGGMWRYADGRFGKR